jgi:hypothetical protein
LGDFLGLGRVHHGVEFQRGVPVGAGEFVVATLLVRAGDAVVGAGLFVAVADFVRVLEGLVVVGDRRGGGTRVAQDSAEIVECLGLMAAAALPAEDGEGVLVMSECFGVPVEPWQMTAKVLSMCRHVPAIAPGRHQQSPGDRPSRRLSSRSRSRTSHSGRFGSRRDATVHGTLRADTLVLHEETNVLDRNFNSTDVMSAYDAATGKRRWSLRTERAELAGGHGATWDRGWPVTDPHVVELPGGPAVITEYAAQREEGASTGSR